MKKIFLLIGIGLVTVAITIFFVIKNGEYKNPGEFLSLVINNSKKTEKIDIEGYKAEARDAQRINDLNFLSDFLKIHMIKVKPEDLVNCVPSKIYSSLIVSSNKYSRNVNGTGWLPLDLNKSIASSGVSVLPYDFVNTGKYIYTFSCNVGDRSFELNAVLESPKNLSKMVGDKGNNNSVYEIGTNLNLIP